MTIGTPLVGIGYRDQIGDWIAANLDKFDVLEITIDHYFYGGPRVRGALEAIARRIPIVAHGVGLSLGTDTPLDEPYLRDVADAVRHLGARRYSEHLAFTKVPGLDLGNLLPLPKTPEVAELIAEKARRVRALLPVPFDLENISYLFDWPDSSMSDGAFLRAICERASAGILLDVENVYVNARNNELDEMSVLTEIPANLVRGMHMAGGSSVSAVLVDSHDQAVPEGAIALLARALAHFQPDSVVLERDDRMEEFDELLDDVARIRSCIARRIPATTLPPVRSGASIASHRRVTTPLIERQRELLAFLTNPRQEDGPDAPVGIDGDRLRLVRSLSLGKRLAKVRSCFPVTLAHLDEPLELLFEDFVAHVPPTDIGRAENAQQFAEFLTERWDHVPPSPPYVPDVLQIELAMTCARRPRHAAGRAYAPVTGPAIRSAAGAQFLNCRYDVRDLFDQRFAGTEPVVREVRLVILPVSGGEDDEGDRTPRIIEVSADLQAILMELDDWRPFQGDDPLGIDAPDGLMENLVAAGLLEVAG